jgi:hypothetical protein
VLAEASERSKRPFFLLGLGEIADTYLRSARVFGQRQRQLLGDGFTDIDYVAGQWLKGGLIPIQRYFPPVVLLRPID